MSHEKKTKGRYVKLPHILLLRWLKAGLTDADLRVIIDAGKEEQ